MKTQKSSSSLPKLQLKNTIPGISPKIADESCLQNRPSNEQRIRAQETPVQMSFTCAAGQESNPQQRTECAVKIRVSLTGGIPLRALRGPDESCESGAPVYSSWHDTWPLYDLLHDIYSKEFEVEYDALAECLQLLQVSDAAKAMIEDAAAQNWEMGLSDLGECAFHIDVPSRKIIMNSGGVSPAGIMRSQQFKNTLMISMLRGLRDTWHERRHGGFDEKYTAESVLMLERVRAADCETLAVLCAWEMREEGYADLWRHVLASDEGDMAIAFGCTLEKQTGAFSIHQALLATFNQWYAVTDRAMICDHETLEYLDAVIQSGERFGSKKASALDVEILSCLPDRTAYLQGEGNVILRAPQYAGLHDEVNQSHYVQVMHDLSVVLVQGVPFRDSALASKIFPNGEMTPEAEGSFQNL